MKKIDLIDGTESSTQLINWLPETEQEQQFLIHYKKLCRKELKEEINRKLEGLE